MSLLWPTLTVQLTGNWNKSHTVNSSSTNQIAECSTTEQIMIPSHEAWPSDYHCTCM